MINSFILLTKQLILSFYFKEKPKVDQLAGAERVNQAFFNSVSGPMLEEAEQISLVWDLVVALWGQLGDTESDDDDHDGGDDDDEESEKMDRGLLEAVQELSFVTLLIRHLQWQNSVFRIKDKTLFIQGGLLSYMYR